MPLLVTEQLESLKAAMTWAAGLRDIEGKKTYFFRQLESPVVAIGRDTKRCAIVLHDVTVSRIHATLRIQGDQVGVLSNTNASNGVYVNERRIDTPLPLTVGMEIELGDSLLIAVDDAGRFPIEAHTLDEFCYKARRRYGGLTAAADALGVSRKFIKDRADRWKQKRYYGAR